MDKELMKSIREILIEESDPIKLVKDTSKFKQIYITYRQSMFYIAHTIIKDEYLAEDIVHQAFLRILDNLDKIDENNHQKTKGFMFVVVKNIAIDFYRKQKSLNNISFDEVEVYMKHIENKSGLMLNEVERSI